jgi:I/LWEQ domain
MAEKAGASDAGGGSETHLRDAANEVNQAIQHLVVAIKGHSDAELAAAQAAAAPPPPTASYELPEHMMAQMEQQELILRMERELKRARERMAAMNVKSSS